MNKGSPKRVSGGLGEPDPRGDKLQPVCMTSRVNIKAPRDPASSRRPVHVLVCFARLAQAPSPIVLADAAVPFALLALAP